MKRMKFVWNELHRMYVCSDGVLRDAAETREACVNENAAGRAVIVQGGPLGVKPEPPSERIVVDDVTREMLS